MCGRFVQECSVTELAELFQAEPIALDDDSLATARYNLAPTDPAAVVVERIDGRRAVVAFRWGLIPHWATSASIAARTINARAETVATTPAFRDALRRRRCLVPAEGFYEWTRSIGPSGRVTRALPPAARRPCAVRLRGPLVELAGPGQRRAPADVRHRDSRRERRDPSDPRPHARCAATRGLGDLAGARSPGPRGGARAARAACGGTARDRRGRDVGEQRPQPGARADRAARGGARIRTGGPIRRGRASSLNRAPRR
ncbi:MAG: SOS response-associated peptidase [Chloroflexi bacterium]|nr:SOS response-associated peptidase [Chloroflexota bacterium]